MNVCTVTTRQRLPYARVLQDSLRQHHPGSTFTALILDGDDELSCPPDLEVLVPQETGLSGPAFHSLAMLLQEGDLALGAVPALLKRLSVTTGESWLYLADDVCLYSDLNELRGIVEANRVTLAYRTGFPLPNDGHTPDQASLLAQGICNPGLIGTGPGSEAFLNWWAGALTEAMASAGPMTTGRILDLAAGFSPCALQEPRWLLSFWNAWGQELIRRGNSWQVDRRAMTLFRFDGYDPEQPHLLSRSQGPRPRMLLSLRPELAELAADYRQRLIEAGLEQAAKLPAAFEQLPGGLKVDRLMRSAYRKAFKAYTEGTAQAPPDPFDRLSPESFVDWLNAPDPASFAPLVPRYLLALYEERLDLRFAYPGLAHADAGRFLDWVMRYGAREARIPPELCRFDQSLRKSPDDDLAELAAFRRLRPAPLPPPGLNVAGYFKAESGVGEMARLLLSGVEEAGIKYSTVAYHSRLSRQGHYFESKGEPFAYGVNLICVNAGELYPFVRDTGSKILRNRYTIGMWWWELEEFPEIGSDTAELFDEIWVGTRHVARGVKARTGKPVHLVPIPIRRMHALPDRAALGLPDRFLFLFTFDFLSAFERKNPLGVIEAFTRAFRENEGPVLVIKSINGSCDVYGMERLRLAAARSDILLMDGYLTPERKDALTASCDCYVSLHRAEGYGLGMAEAMALGKPIIATGYSGNLAFLNERNSFLVGYELASVPPGAPPYPEGATWAAPDLDEAAHLMREVFRRPGEAARRGQLAQHQALQMHTPQATARFIRSRLEEIRRIQAQRRGAEFIGRLAAGIQRRVGFRKRSS